MKPSFRVRIRVILLKSPPRKPSLFSGSIGVAVAEIHASDGDGGVRSWRSPCRLDWTSLGFFFPIWDLGPISLVFTTKKFSSHYSNVCFSTHVPIFQLLDFVFYRLKLRFLIFFLLPLHEYTNTKKMFDFSRSSYRCRKCSFNFDRCYWAVFVILTLLQSSLISSQKWRKYATWTLFSKQHHLTKESFFLDLCQSELGN